MKINRKLILITLLLILIGLLIWFSFFRQARQEIVLETEPPGYGYIAQSVTATGTIQPLDTVSVGTQVSGTISVLNADFNSIVKKGQLLASLDKTLLQAEVDRNTATLHMQRSQLSFDQNNFERQKQLYATGSISRLEYERALNNYNAAASAVKSMEAQLKSSTKNLSFADIYSPIDGVVLSRNISLGQTVAAMFNTPTLFVIAKDITKMQVQAAIDEADIGEVSKGQRASFTVDAFINDSFKGTVSEVRLHPKVSANVVSYTTIIKAPNDAMKLKPGMTANIIVYTREIPNALKISAKALSFSPDSALTATFKLHRLRRSNSSSKGSPEGSSKLVYVWVKRGDVLEQRPITIGIDDNKYVQVISGLSPYDLVVTAMSVPDQATESPTLSVSAENQKKP